MHLLETCGLLGKGYHLFTDNLYTKVSLAQQLLNRSTMLTGTIRSNSKNFPSNLLPARMQPQTASHLRSGMLLACAYKDKKSQKKPVMLLSTGCSATNYSFEKRGEAKMKPSMVLEYNKGMGGVDMSDRKIYQIASERTTLRFWVKIFRNLIEISLRNSYEIYKLSVDKPLSCQDFCGSVVESFSGKSDPIPAPPIQAHAHSLKTLEGGRERDCVFALTAKMEFESAPALGVQIVVLEFTKMF